MKRGEIVERPRRLVDYTQKTAVHSCTQLYTLATCRLYTVHVHKYSEYIRTTVVPGTVHDRNLKVHSNMCVGCAHSILHFTTKIVGVPLCVCRSGTRAASCCTCTNCTTTKTLVTTCSMQSFLDSFFEAASIYLRPSGLDQRVLQASQQGRWEAPAPSGPMRIAASLLVCWAHRCTSVCTEEEMCPSARSLQHVFDGSVTAYHLCYAEGLVYDLDGVTGNELQASAQCTGCPANTNRRTRAACEAAGNRWTAVQCSSLLGHTEGVACSTMIALISNLGHSCCAHRSPPSPPPPSPPPPPAFADACFPSSALVTKADGATSRVDELKEGDVIVAVSADGDLTTDVVSLLSIAKPEAHATSYVALTCSSNATLTLTPEHHLPVGGSCCSSLKKAKHVVVGDIVWSVEKGARKPVAAKVVAKAVATATGLHSPVLTNGGFPVVDGITTAFDSIDKMMLAKRGLAMLLAACKVTASCETVRNLFFGDDRQYLAAAKP